MEEQIKISFVGDIMCEKPQLQASKVNGNYEFDKMFNNIKKCLQKSDFVIGNLETPISNILGYTNELYSFNTPKEFLKSLKDCNFKLLITANNHCLDRGVLGLNQTMKNIKKYNMDYVGTYINKKDKSEIRVKEISGVKVAFIAYTYGTNYGYNKYTLSKNNIYKVNLIKKQISDPKWKKYCKINPYKTWAERAFKNKIKQIIKYNKQELSSKNDIIVDELDNNEWIIDNANLELAKQDIKNAKSKSDIVVFMLHSGGQFNKNPGSFTKKVIEEIEKEDIDCIIGTHPHVVQKSEYKNDKFITYSLGNFSISPSTPYLKFDLLPEYSIILHCYINKVTKQIEKYNFSIVKTIEDNNHYLSIYLVKDLIDMEKDENKKQKLIQDNLFIYNQFLQKDEKEIKIQEEYEIKKE